VIDALVVVGLVVAALVVFHAVHQAPAAMQLSVLHCALDGLPAAFDGMRIAILTDLHHGPQQPLARAIRAVSLANSQRPDLVVLLGDYGTSGRRSHTWSRQLYHHMFDELATALVRLRASDGVLAILGNHDYYADAAGTAAWLRSLRFDVLVNASHDIVREGQLLRFVGLDDLAEGHVSRDQVTGLAGDASCVIALSHQPDGVGLCTSPAIRLVLSGHSHGGQVVIPLIGAPITRSAVCTRRHPAGWVPNRVTRLFVSRGIGVQIPVRLFCPPEVVVLVLGQPSDRQHPT
jgi:uncharacterized protein